MFDLPRAVRVSDVAPPDGEGGVAILHRRDAAWCVVQRVQQERYRRQGRGRARRGQHGRELQAGLDGAPLGQNVDDNEEEVLLPGRWIVRYAAVLQPDDSIRAA